MTTTLTAHHVTTSRLGGQIHVVDENTDRTIGVVDVILGFAYFTGRANTAAQGVTAIVRGGIDGLVATLDTGLVSGRDDRR